MAKNVREEDPVYSVGHTPTPGGPNSSANTTSIAAGLEQYSKYDDINLLMDNVQKLVLSVDTNPEDLSGVMGQNSIVQAVAHDIQAEKENGFFGRIKKFLGWCATTLKQIPALIAKMLGAIQKAMAMVVGKVKGWAGVTQELETKFQGRGAIMGSEPHLWVWNATTCTSFADMLLRFQGTIGGAKTESKQVVVMDKAMLNEYGLMEETGIDTIDSIVRFLTNKQHFMEAARTAGRQLAFATNNADQLDAKNAGIGFLQMVYYGLVLIACAFWGVGVWVVSRVARIFKGGPQGVQRGVADANVAEPAPTNVASAAPAAGGSLASQVFGV